MVLVVGVELDEPVAEPDETLEEVAVGREGDAGVLGPELLGVPGAVRGRVEDGVGVGEHVLGPEGGGEVPASLVGGGQPGAGRDVGHRLL